MQRATRWMLVLLVCLAVPVGAGAAQAEDKKPAEKPLDRKALDESIYRNLRGVIDHGATLYNQGDWNGCYRLWEGALMTLKPLLDHRPKLQEAIDKGIADARQDPALWHRAWVLRPVLDKIRSDIHPKKQEAGAPRVAAPKPKTNTLWDRLGGETGVTKIVDDFVKEAGPDPKVNFFRGGKYKPTDEQVTKMKRELVEQISEASGGPLKYTGPDMKAIHKGMGITEAQFQAAAADLKKVLEKNNVAPEDVEKVLTAVGNYRKEIVEPKRKDEKKSVEKKEENKPADTANVEGKITFKGKPLTGGKIVFTSKKGEVEGTIDMDGTYHVMGAKPGDYTVSIKGAKGAKIPAVYEDPKTSPLLFNAKEGKQTHDIVLE